MHIDFKIGRTSIQKLGKMTGAPMCNLNSQNVMNEFKLDLLRERRIKLIYRINKDQIAHDNLE